MPSSISSSDRAQVAPAPAGLLVLVRGFVLTLLLLVAATEMLVRMQVLPQDTWAGHLDLLHTATHADAAFGDSHVARGFAAQGDFVNLAYPSENIEDMSAKVRLHYADRTPGRVVIQADPHLFAAYRLFASSKPAGAQFRSGSTPLLHLTSERHRPQLVAYWQAFLEGFGTLESKVNQTPNGALLSQGDFAALPDRAQQLEARTRLTYHALGPADAVVAAQARYTEMIDFLRAKGADICLVSFPVTRAYLATTRDAQSGHQRATDFFRQTAGNTGARYVDARAHVSSDALFRDVDHLNVAGAKAFYTDLVDLCFDE